LILRHFFKYTLSSLFSSVVDEGLYMLLSWLLQPVLSGFWFSAVPIVIARIVSSLTNFYMNKRLVFKSKMSTRSALIRYTLLAIPILLAQAGLTYGLTLLFGISESQIILRGVIHAAVMIVLFVASFLVQQRWVFAAKSNTTQEV
jgi:putative flippase GtrA